jgi:hypothetical protein
LPFIVGRSAHAVLAVPTAKPANIAVAAKPRAIAMLLSFHGANQRVG